MDKTDNEWREFCRPYVHMNGSHEMPNYAAICRAVLALAPKPWHYTEGGVETIDLDRSMWEEVKAAARESKWMPAEYMMNDWVADVCSWLKDQPPPMTHAVHPLPEGWRLVVKKTHYALLDGDTVVASLAGPDAERYAAILAKALAETPVDVVLHCPDCGAQHIDRADAPEDGADWNDPEIAWTNPPHRSHLCAKCGFQWRPSDVPTNGVAAVTTKGAHDSSVASTTLAALSPAETLRGLLEEAFNGLKWYRDAHPEDDSQADDELYTRIEAALAEKPGKR